MDFSPLPQDNVQAPNIPPKGQNEGGSMYINAIVIM